MPRAEWRLSFAVREESLSTVPRSTRSFLFRDVNVWAALTWQGHVHHRVARATGSPPSVRIRVSLFCRFTQLGLMRLLTAEAVMADDVMNQQEVWDDGGPTVV